MVSPAATPNRYLSVFLGVVFLFCLYLTSLTSYLLFHSLSEMFSVIVGCGVFMIAWNARRFINNNYLLFIGIAYLFVSVLDIVHTFAYKGMGVFPGQDANLPTQLWVAARSLQAVSLLLAPLFITRRLNAKFLLAAYAATTALALWAIFTWRVFPDCYIEGSGLTPFKTTSEYVISLVLLISIVILYQRRDAFDRNVLAYLILSIASTAISELNFTVYTSVYGFSNMLGHLFKIVAFYLMYKAMIETTLVRPYSLLFRNLKESEDAIRRERDKAQNYLDVARAILVVINADLRVGLINKKGCEILGLPERGIVGKNWFDTFVPERMRREVKGAFAKLMAGEADPVEYFENPILARTGEEKIIAWHNALLRDDSGAVIATLSSGEDITARKHAEEKLAQKTTELERSNKELEMFAYAVSHDLKEPLLTIGGFTELLEDRYQKTLDTKGRDYISRIVTGVFRMESLINDLLGYSRVTTQGKPFAVVDMTAALQTSLDNLKMTLDESAAEVIADPLPKVTGDEIQMVQLFQNLIGNAVKYRRAEPPRIRISARQFAESGARTAQSASPSSPSETGTGWLFTVSDNGIGIDPKYYEHIFVIFQRLHKAGEYPGTGIGLAVCKRIVERHGGSIWVESSPGKGSTFSFILP